ncbi:MAG: hypothetical protein HC808_09755 [Candidatus Competibacteraceae bacterium]|nr:hypothetical protein [Candidatus Competibacteraceae bacterium]
MAIDISSIISSGNLSDLDSNISTAASGDLTDPANQLQLQQALAEYQETYGTYSAIISDMKSTVMSIIQKM